MKSEMIKKLWYRYRHPEYSGKIGWFGEVIICRVWVPLIFVVGVLGLILAFAGIISFMASTIISLTMTAVTMCLICFIMLLS